MARKNVSVNEPSAVVPSAASTSKRHAFFIKRLKELGLYDENSDYGGMIGRAVEGLSETFANQGHSGGSAAITLAVFKTLMYEYENPSKEELNKTAEELGLPKLP